MLKIIFFNFKWMLIFVWYFVPESSVKGTEVWKKSGVSNRYRTKGNPRRGPKGKAPGKVSKGKNVKKGKGGKDGKGGKGKREEK